jgi:hypothetical protein
VIRVFSNADMWSSEAGAEELMSTIVTSETVGDRVQEGDTRTSVFRRLLTLSDMRREQVATVAIVPQMLG